MEPLIRCETTSCVHQGQGKRCWVDRGPIIKDKICQSYEEDLPNSTERGDKEMIWGMARKKPITIEFREPITKIEAFDSEWIDTLEGRMRAIKGRDFIIKGVEGELYPIKKEIFFKTYDVLQSPEVKTT